MPVFALLLHLTFLWSSASTQTVSCVLFEDYLSPGFTYKVFYTKDKGACCKFCADDDNCVAWSRDIMTGKCALKRNCEILIAIAGAESGVKHISPQEPVLEYNGVGAYVIVAKTSPPPPPPSAPAPVRPPPAPQGFSFSSSSSATGSGNGQFSSSFSSVTVDENGVRSVSSTTGNAVATTAVETPTLSLATTTVAEDGKTSKLAVTYYKNATYVGTVPLVNGKPIQIIANASAEPPCLTCFNYTCLATPGIVYKGKTSLFKTLF